MSKTYTAKEIAEKTLEIIDSLQAVIEKENNLLSERKYDEVAANAENKAALVRNYEAILKKLEKHKDVLATIDDGALKTTLTEKGMVFEEIMKKNYFKLQSVAVSARRVSERITKAILEKVKEEPATYNANGTMRGASKNKQQAAMTDGAY